MIEMLSGTSAGWPTDLKTMNLPRRSIFASWEIFNGGSIGISPSPCHSPIRRSNSFIAGLLFGDRVQTIRLSAKLRCQVEEILGDDIDRDVERLWFPGAPFMRTAHEGGSHTLSSGGGQVVGMRGNHH